MGYPMSDERTDAVQPDTVIPQPLALNAKQAAKMLGLGKTLLWSLTNRREVPHIRIGRRVLYPVAALSEWLERNTRGKR